MLILYYKTLKDIIYIKDLRVQTQERIDNDLFSTLSKVKDTHKNYNTNGGQEEKLNLYKDGIYNN